jgi:cell wall assembly regulator SMI1
MDQELIGRIRARIADDARRTGDGDYLRMPADFRARCRSGEPLIWRPLTGWMDEQAAAELAPLKPIEPLKEAAVAKIEKSLGFGLPDELRQLYLEIGDGGFGPYNGVRRLSNWARDYSKLRAELPAERGREWPEALLPIVYRQGKRICVDRTSGAVVLWTKPPKRASEKKWLASFVPQSPSVGEWLERWVDTPTQIEDGPEGGWAPPGEEIARRDSVEREKAERRAAELQRAQTINHGDLPPLEPELLGRLRARAMDPGRRTYFASAPGSPSNLATLEEELEDGIKHLPPAAMGLVGLFKAVKKLGALTGPLEFTRVALGDGPGVGMVMFQGGPGPAGGKLGAPATDSALAHAEQRLGFALPAPLVQLYRIADGGFGPGFGGLASLARMIELYRKLTVTRDDEPAWKPWPARRLPIFEEGTGLGCLNLETGRINVYEILGMDHPSSRDWRRCDDEWESVAAMLEDWLGRRTFREEQGRLAS